MSNNLSAETQNSFGPLYNKKKGKSRIPGRMHSNDKYFDTPKDIVNAFMQHFSSMYIADSRNADFASDALTNTQCINIKYISEKDIIDAIYKLKKNQRTSGHDQVPSFLIQDCSGALTKPLLTIFNLSIKTSVFPDVWKIAREPE